MLSQVSPGLSLLALSEVEKLRLIFRLGWKERGVAYEDLENDFEHTLRVQLCTLILPVRRRVNHPRAVTIALLHDLDEIILGDEVRRNELKLPLEEEPRLISIVENEALNGLDHSAKVSRALKLIAFEIVTANWPSPAKEEALQLYNEYTFAWSPEAKLVHQAHCVADLLMGLGYIAGYIPQNGRRRFKKRYRKIDLSTFWEDAEAASNWTDAPIDLPPVLEELRSKERELRAA